jgi:hypothetical protein
MKKHQFLALLPASVLLLTACDDAGAPLEPGSTLRKAGEIIKQQTPTSKSFAVRITPDPTQPGGGTGPLFESVIRNADSVFGAAFQGSIEAQEFCPEACAEGDAEWNERVSANGEYDIVDMYEFELEDGTIAIEAQVVGEVAMACHCEG